MIEPDSRIRWVDGREMFLTKRPQHEESEYLWWFITNEMHTSEFILTPRYIGFLNEADITLFHLKYPG